MNKLKQLTTKDEFVRVLGFKNTKYINYLLYKIRTENLYETFSIPKKMVEKELFTLLKEI